MFYFRLALALGMTVRELLERVDSVELTEWRAYYTLEPFGELVADQRHGILTSTLANVNRNPQKTPEPYTLRDFIPWMRVRGKQDAPVLKADPEEQSALVKRTLFGGALRMLKKPRS